MKKRILTGMLTLVFVLLTAAAAAAATTTKPIDITYRNIKLLVDGKAVSLLPSEEPFIYAGRTFIPIRLAAEALGFNVEWVDWSSTVKISGPAAVVKENEALKLQLKQKDAEIASLKNKLAKCADDLRGLEDDLNDDYDRLEDVRIDDIKLDGDEDDVDVEIEVDLEDYAGEWRDLSDSDIKEWIRDLVGDIQDEFTDDTEVRGKIIDIDSDDMLVKFYKYGESTLRVIFYDDDYRGAGAGSAVEAVINELEDSYHYIDDIRFRMDIFYNEDDKVVSARLTAVYSTAAADWEALGSRMINNEVKDICEDIADAFEDDADISLETINIRFDNRSSVLLDRFEYDVDSGVLD